MYKKCSERGGKEGSPQNICPRFYDSALMLNGNLRERLCCDIEHRPVQVQSGKGISHQICLWDTGGVFRCNIFKVKICLHYLKIYQTCHDLVTIKKKIARETPKSAGKGENVGNKHYQVHRT